MPTRRGVLARLLTTGALALLGACGPGSMPPLEGAKLEGAKKAADALGARSIDPNVRGFLAASALAEIEVGRLPAPIVKALDAVATSGVDASQKATILYSGITEVQADWAKVCPDSKAFEAIAGKAVPPSEKSKVLYEKCDFQRFGVLTAAEAPQYEAMFLATGFLSLDYLDRRKSLSEPERTLILALLRVPIEPSKDPNR